MAPPEASFPHKPSESVGNPLSSVSVDFRAGGPASTLLRDHHFELPPPCKPVSIAEFEAEIRGYLGGQDVTKTLGAYYYAEAAHKDQYRRTGDPYITHPLYVAFLLARMRMDYQTLMAALLHDVIEDTDNSRYTLREHFEPTVADLVDGVSKLSDIFDSRVEAQANNLQKMFMAMARDIRVILIKFADRLHNMYTLSVMPIEKRRRIAKETLDFYAPMAGRLGMDDVRHQFEDLGFRYLHPVYYKEIKEATERIQGEHHESLKQTQDTIKSALEVDGIKAEVIGRTKQPYSTYNKMKATHKPLNQLTDVLALRVIVEDVDTCYRALGVIHNTYRPMPNSFKDYIAIPKKNGYQSLHTVLFGQPSESARSTPMEIQIRTRLMDDMALKGIAAHWLYKSRNSPFPDSHIRVGDLVQKIKTLQERSNDPTEFIDDLRTDLLGDEVYVFSPTGEIIDLPPEASPVDFAYALDPELGNNCASCRIDRHVAPLSTPLSSGQTVEIITSKDAIPRAEWLSFVVTGTARSHIRYALKHLQRSSSVAFGRDLLQRSLENFDLAVEDLPADLLALVLKKLQACDLDDLFYQIGIGDKLPYFVARTLALQADSPNVLKDGVLSLAHSGPITIRGTEGVVVEFAECCRPIPGDPVMGHIKAGSGIVIHVETCSRMNAIRRAEHEIHPVRWMPDPGAHFSVALEVETRHRKSSISELAAAVSEADSAVERVELKEEAVGMACIAIIMKVSDRKHLATVIKNLRNVKDVVHIRRPR